MSVRFLSGVNVDSNTLFVDDANNRVGIGTASPSYKLDVNVASNSDALRVQQAGASKFILTGDGVMTWGASAASGVLTWDTNIVYIGGLTNNALGIWAGGSEKVRITTGGNVGIGTTSPAEKIVVSGGSVGIAIDGTTSSRTYYNRSGAYIWSTGLRSGDTKFHIFDERATDRLVIDDSGNVGIGTTAPGYLLDVAGTSRSDLHIFRSNQSAPTADAFIFRPADNTIALGTANAERMRITSAGNVGIGTTSPGSKLDVISGTSQIADFRSTVVDGLTNIRIVNDQQTTASGTSPAAIELIGKRGSSTHGRHAWIGAEGVEGTTYRTQIKFKIRPEDSPYQWSTLPTQMVIDGNGNVGIGTTSPSYKLQIAEDTYARIALHQTTTGAIWNWGNDGSNMYAYYTNTAVRAIDITNTGNVGIGTTSPSARLQIGNGTSNSPSSVAVLSADGGNAVLNALSLVNSRVAANGNGTSINFHNASNYGSTGRITSVQDSGTNASLRFSVYNSTDDALVERVTLLSSGNVGIGTTSPSAILHVATASTTGTTSMLVLSRASGYGQTLFEQIYDSTYFTAGKTLTLKNDSGTAFVHFAGNNAGTRTDLLIPTGNVGIGTTSPAALLNVGGTGTLHFTESGIGSMLLKGASGTARGMLEVHNGDSSSKVLLQAYTGGAGVGTLSNTALDIVTNSTTRMVVTGAGNVGIGTTSPAYKFNVVTNAVAGKQNLAAIDRTSGNLVTFTNPQYSTDASMGLMLRVFPQSDARQGAGIIASGGSNNAVTDLDLFVTTSPDGLGGTSYSALKINGLNGNVGIGTTSPVSLLNLNNGDAWINVTDTLRGLQFGYAGPSHGSYRAAVMGGAESYGGTDSGMLTFHTQNGYVVSAIPPERMRITSAGNVGIGTDSPSTKLHTVGNIRSANAGNTVYSELQNDGVYAVGTDLYLLAPASKFVSIYAGNAERMRIASTGATRLNAYGSGSITGTAAYNLAVDASGNVIETAGGVVDGSGTANYVTKWQDANTVTNSIIRDDGTTVGVGQAPAAAKMSVNGALNAGGRYLYNNFQSSLDTTGVAVAGLSASSNGDSAFFTFEAGASNGQYQRIVWSCYNAAGDWNVVKVIDEGTNAFDVVASASSGATITFTWKSRSGILYYTPRLIITGVGSINTSYL